MNIPTPKHERSTIKPIVQKSPPKRRDDADKQVETDLRETAQEDIHQVMPKTEVPGKKQASGPDGRNGKPPLRAAKGDDDLMSAPQRAS